MHAKQLALFFCCLQHAPILPSKKISFSTAKKMKKNSSNEGAVREEGQIALLKVNKIEILSALKSQEES